LTLCGAVALGECYLIYERWSASRAAAKRLIQRTNDLGEMANALPPPKLKVAEAIEADLARAERALAAMQAELKGKGPLADKLRAAKVPAARTDSYFDLATYVERMRELARKNGVAIRSEAARFGFGSYANEAPETERIEPVFRQRQVAQYLVESLLEAKPASLVAIKREPTLTAAEREAQAAARAQAIEQAAANGQPPDLSAVPETPLPEGPDYFVINPRASARMPGYVDTEAFRFVFTGQTAALRAFLNRLASFELPVLVREVEVEPASAEEAAEPTAEETAAAGAEAATAPAASVVLTAEADAAAATPAAKPASKTPARARTTLTPIVAKPVAKFTVTVEYVTLVAPTPPPAETATPAPNS
jgi:hypothetical protein